MHTCRRRGIFQGLQSKIVDEMILRVLNARSRDELTAAQKALDRILLWKFLMIPLIAVDGPHVLYWDRFGRPLVRRRVPHPASRKPGGSTKPRRRAYCIAGLKTSHSSRHARIRADMRRIVVATVVVLPETIRIPRNCHRAPVLPARLAPAPTGASRARRRARPVPTVLPRQRSRGAGRSERARGPTRLSAL